MTGRITRKRMDIERLVNWALVEQGLGWAGHERDKLDFSDYGTLIDDDHPVSHPTIGLLCHDDALVVKAGIDALPVEARALVIQYGRASLRPDWAEEGYGDWAQLRDARGRPRWEWSDPVNRTGERRPLIGFVGLDRETVDFHRAAYALWWQGLADLVLPLNTRLEEHFAIGPEAAAKPWLVPRPVVYGEDGKPMADVRRSRAPERSDTAAELRARAQAPVSARATDWGTPDHVLHRQESRGGKGQARNG